MKKVFLCIFLLSLIRASGADIRISLFNNHQVSSVVVSAWNGDLTVSAADSFSYVIADGQAIFVTLLDGEILLMGERSTIGSFEKVSFQGVDSLALVRIRPTEPQLEARNYEDMIVMSVDVNKIQIINHIEEDKYIAGVIEAEVGQGHTAEFYKAKAIICRTYLYMNINRHRNEGFHLCDEVHCQVYKGQCRSRALIVPAVLSTKNVVITDRQTSRPILATYHSNCGGVTEASQNVWQSALPYLTPVVDPYCTSTPNARWQRTIPLDEWIAFLVRRGFTPNPNVVTDFSFQQLQRAVNYRVGATSIPFTQIRTEFNLRSAFFSVSVEDGNVVLRGRGFGHGVGLCQQGAMEMGRRGFKYNEIINYYYRNVSITTLDIATMLR